VLALLEQVVHRVLKEKIFSADILFIIIVPITLVCAVPLRLMRGSTPIDACE
jgi:hypothetical protein